MKKHEVECLRNRVKKFGSCTKADCEFGDCYLKLSALTIEMARGCGERAASSMAVSAVRSSAESSAGVPTKVSGRSSKGLPLWPVGAV